MTISHPTSSESSGSRVEVALFSAVLRVRPRQLGDLLKRVLHVPRRAVRTLAGQTLSVDPISYLGFQLFRDGIYEPQMTRLLQTVLRPGDVFVDVGGNEGYFSLLAASLVRDGKVYCFEPQSRLQPVLEENIRLNDARSVEVHPVALSDEIGSVDLYLRPNIDTGASSVVRWWKVGSTKETIRTVTLDSIFERSPVSRIRLLKSDCEGSEPLAVRGGLGTIRRRIIEFIAMEYHPHICGADECDWVDAELRAAGYVLTKVNDQCVYHLPGLQDALAPLGDLRVGCRWNE
jgi:FkbM family methyltransferase